MLHKLITTVYRHVAIVTLFGLMAAVLCYIFLVVFYTANSSWAAPITLSPAQERVLSFQPQVASLEASLDKQKIDLATANVTVTALSDQVKQLDSLLVRLNSASSSEAKNFAQVNRDVSVVLSAKREDILSTEKLIAEARGQLKLVQEQLAARLITTDQATSQRLSLQSALNAATDARATAIQLDQQRVLSAQSASTLSGGNSSLTALNAVSQIAQMRALEAQLRIQLATAVSTKEALDKSIFESERVLRTAKTSPYYEALRSSVYVAFVPYSNLKSVKTGQAVYDCYLQVIFCSKIGEVGELYEAEEYARHPLFKSDLKGRLVGLKLTDKSAAQSQAVFIGGKPLFF